MSKNSVAEFSSRRSRRTERTTRTAEPGRVDGGCARPERAMVVGHEPERDVTGSADPHRRHVTTSAPVWYRGGRGGGGGSEYGCEPLRQRYLDVQREITKTFR